MKRGLLLFAILLSLSTGGAHAGSQATMSRLKAFVAEGDYFKAYVTAVALPASDDRAYIEWAGYHAADLPSVMIYVMGQRLFKISRYDGLRWVTLGRLRLWQDLDICDIKEGQRNTGAMLLDMSVKEVIDYRLNYQKAALDATRWAVEWDEDHNHTANPGWSCLAAKNLAFITLKKKIQLTPSPVKEKGLWSDIRKASNKTFLDRQIKLSGG